MVKPLLDAAPFLCEIHSKKCARLQCRAMCFIAYMVELSPFQVCVFDVVAALSGGREFESVS